MAEAGDIPAEPSFAIKHFEVSGNTLLDAGVIATTLAAHAGSGRHFADIEAARRDLLARYVASGYAAVEVIIPEQEISTGKVSLQVVEHKVGKIVTLGAQHHDNANILASVPDLRQGQTPNSLRLAEELRLASENPSKHTYLLFRPAKPGGDIDAVLRVDDEKPWKAYVSLDDTGSAATGNTRLTVGYQNANFGNRDDVLTLQYVTSPERLGDVAILGAGYHFPLYARSSSIDLYAGHSNVSAGNVADAFNVTGRGTVVGGTYTYNLPKQSALEQKLSLGFDYRAYSNAGTLDNQYTVHPLTLGYKGQWSNQADQAGYLISAIANVPGGDHGNDADFSGVRSGASADYQMLRYSANFSHVFPSDWLARAALDGQYARQPLVPGEQFGLGGHDSVRGFGERIVTGDRGWRLGLEILTPVLGGQVSLEHASLRLLGFFDGGQADRLRAQPGETPHHAIASAGIGARFGLDKHLSARLDYGHVLAGDADAETRSGSARFHASVSYIF